MFVITARAILLRIRNVSEKVAQNIEAHFMFSTVFFEIRAMYEIMSKNMVEPDRPQMTIWRMRIACWIPKATDTFTIFNTHCFSITTIFA
jgi:hypothetical protein